MAKVLGLNAKIFRGTKGSTANIEMTNVKNVTINLTANEADITTRATQGWKASIGTLKEGSVSFGMLFDTEDSDCNALQSAFMSNELIALFVTDGLGTGLDADFAITEFSIEQSLEEAVSVSVTAKVSQDDREPTWVTGSGSR